MDQSNDTFREDLLTVLFHLRISQMMLGILRDNPHARDSDDYKLLRRLSKEPFQKIEWYVSLASRVMEDDQELISELNSRDDKLMNIANLSTFVATLKGDLSNATDLMTNGAWRKELFWDAWRHGWESSADHSGVRPQRIYTEFEEWYNKLFPNNISSLQKSTNESAQ